MYNIICLLSLICHNCKANIERELSDKEWELIQIIRDFRKMYPQSVEFEIYINHLLAELMYDEQEEEN